MIIKIKDIPAQGFNADFEVPRASLNARLKPDVAKAGPNASHLSADYDFSADAETQVKLELEGSTVIVTGNVVGKYHSPCARCAEDTEQSLSLNIRMILKPITTRGTDRDSDEDVDFGFYDGKEVNCSAIVEEQLILALPYTVLCSETCKGLCPSCGANLNDTTCNCQPQAGDERFAVLQTLKLH